MGKIMLDTHCMEAYLFYLYYYYYLLVCFEIDSVKFLKGLFRSLAVYCCTVLYSK